MAPVAWLLILYACVVPKSNDWSAVAGGAVASLSVYGFIRFLHGLLASDEYAKHFYTSAELKEVRDRGSFEQSHSKWAHLLPGAAYIFFFWFAAVLLARL